MKFQFSEKKVRLPENVHAYAEKKITKLDRYFNGDAEALVAFSVMKNRNQVELTVHAANTWFRAGKVRRICSPPSMRLWLPLKGRSGKIRRGWPGRLRQDAFVRSPSAEEVSFAPEAPEEEFEIVRRKKFPMKPMTQDEAILQMNLLEHSFFAFKDEDNGGAFAVVYRRNDGGYGLIEDED